MDIYLVGVGRRKPMLKLKKELARWRLGRTSVSMLAGAGPKIDRKFASVRI
jgi:hypothetical protein